MKMHEDYRSDFAELKVLAKEYQDILDDLKDVSEIVTVMSKEIRAVADKAGQLTHKYAFEGDLAAIQLAPLIQKGADDLKRLQQSILLTLKDNEF